MTWKKKLNLTFSVENRFLLISDNVKVLKNKTKLILSENKPSKLRPCIFCLSPRIIFFRKVIRPLEKVLHKGSTDRSLSTRGSGCHCNSKYLKMEESLLGCVRVYTYIFITPLTMNIPAAKHLETELISFQVIDVGFLQDPIQTSSPPWSRKSHRQRKAERSFHTARVSPSKTLDLYDCCQKNLHFHALLLLR